MTAKDWLTRAKNEGFAIGAFNAANLETVKAIVTAARNQASPVIIEASHGEIEYFGYRNFLDVITNFREETNLPIFTNLDHAPTLDDAAKGIDLGFDLVHYNGSHLPFEKNQEETKKVCTLAYQKGILVEAELDTIPGGSSIHLETAEEELAKTKLTDPDQAAAFEKETGLDTLAASFGSVHGFYQTKKHINLSRLRDIRAKTSCFLSLHGGSGMPDEQVKEAIKIGIVKINVNSELRLAFRETLKKSLNETGELAAYKYIPPAIDAVREIVEGKIKLFGSNKKI